MENKMQENKTNEVTQTEVTSIQKEEEKTGQKINVPSAEELVSRAGGSFITNKKYLAELFPKLSSRAKNRVLLAILDLPTDGIPVNLKEDEEKLCFALGQRVISDRFILTQHYINEERKRIAAELAAKEQEGKTEVPAGQETK